MMHFDSTRPDHARAQHVRATAYPHSEIVMLDGQTRTLSQLRTAEAWLDGTASGQQRDAAAAMLLHSPYADQRRKAKRHLAFRPINDEFDTGRAYGWMVVIFIAITVAATLGGPLLGAVGDLHQMIGGAQ